MRERKLRVQVFLQQEDWDYLGKMADIMGTSRSAIARECIETFTGYMKKSLGDLHTEKVDATKFMRVMLLEASEAIRTASEITEFIKDKQTNGC